MEQVEKCSNCGEYGTLADNLCNDCTIKPEFTKKNIASIGTEPAMTFAINEIDHLHCYKCDSCIKMSEDEDFNIVKVRWFGQSRAEVETLKTFHEANNEGHVGVCYER